MFVKFKKKKEKKNPPPPQKKKVASRKTKEIRRDVAWKTGRTWKETEEKEQC